MEGSRELPLRGHRDDVTVATEDSNQGNYRVLESPHAQNEPHAYIYMSITSQNELLSCIGEYLLND